MKDSKESCFYAILGLQKTCSTSDVRCAYRKLAKQWHPDKCASNGSTAVESAKASESAKTRFQAIQEAYSVLSDNNKRLMYDAGVYDDDDDELEMGAFMGEMAAMMTGSTKEVDGADSLDDLKAMFLNIVDADPHKPGSSNKRSSACLSEKTEEKLWMSMPSSASGSQNDDFFMGGFSSGGAPVGIGSNGYCTSGDGVDSLQELKQMFMSIVDPEFYSSGCSSIKASIASFSQKDKNAYWTNGMSAFDELVAETLFPEATMNGSRMDGPVLETKSSTATFCSDVSNTPSVAVAEEGESKKRKLCQAQNAVSKPSVEHDFASSLSMGDFNCCGDSCSDNEDWDSSGFF